MNYFKQYEYFEEFFLENRLLLLQYKLLYRNWKNIDKTELEENIEKAVQRPMIEDGKIQWKETEFRIKDIVSWNAGYINKAEILDKIVDDSLEKGYYTEFINDTESIFDVFFMGEQPMLDVVSYDVQKKAACMLNDVDKPNYHLVFDEVGTGKTVSALYCIRDIISIFHRESKILIICPNNKKSEWQKDIKRQLGLYAHNVENSIDCNAYSGNIKEIYFKENEPAIFIEGQKSDQKNDGLDKWDNKIKWDLIVIDEGHQCFKNYTTLKAQRAILLTATPIVVNSRSNEGKLEISKIITPNNYIELLYNIVGGDKVDLKNLFSERNVFTQLFREDLGIVPKNRNIKQITCKRWEEREIYLDVLAEVKGGLTKLMYEQDDAMLIYGIFEKFKDDIKKEGYMIDDQKPLFENTKQKKLIDYLENIENSKKSYIIFYNSKWPANELYKVLVGKNMSNTIVAIKFGGNYCEVWPKDYSVHSSNVFDYLQGKIDLGVRVLFITTGASGGTGLNLGKFDGVINYELPFTSIELEQRFGRVDRMDVENGDEKEMVFIFNEDYNPVLRYALLKINKTCEYMPIRNTILFCKEVMDFLTKSLKMELSNCSLESSEEKVLSEYINMIKSIEQNDKELIYEILTEIAKKGNLEEFEIDGYSENTQAFIEFINHNRESISKIISKSKKMRELENEITHWCNLVSAKEYKDEVLENSIVSYSIADDETEYEEYQFFNGMVESNAILIKEDENKKNEKSFVFDDMIDLWTKIDGKLKTLEDNLDYQISTGLFYIQDRQYRRETVEQYRKKMKGGN